MEIVLSKPSIFNWNSTFSRGWRVGDGRSHFIREYSKKITLPNHHRYISPYLGRATWGLTENGEFIIHKFTRPLSVRRRRGDWGWTIGKGSRSEYWSVLPPSKSSNRVLIKSSTTSSTSSRNIIQRFLTC